jgi:SAM-dependent methyltransferase
MSEDRNLKHNRNFWGAILACPNCCQNLDFATNSYQFENPLFSIFEGEILHAESEKSRLAYSKECGNCHFPVEPIVDSQSGKIKLLFPTDWLLVKLDKSQWSEWKVKQLNSYVAGLLDPQASYFHEDNPVGSSFAKFVEKNIDFFQLSILDAGCGALPKPIYLRNASDCDLFGIDPFDSNFDGHLSNSPAEFLPFRNNSFDLIVASSAIDHFLDWKKSIAEFKRVLRSNGKLAIYQHLSGVDSKYPGTLINGRWYRIFQHGYLVELLDEFDDPFHTKISQTLGWDVEISKYLTDLGFNLIDFDLDNGFSVWKKH